MRPLSVRVPADPENVRALRARLRDWLAGTVEDLDVVEDLLLAVSEAVENVVDHAFVGREAGTVALSAHRDGHPPTVVIVVSDDGHWQPPPDPGYRGRGLAMIGQLCSSHELETGVGGTRVTMHRRL